MRDISQDIDFEKHDEPPKRSLLSLLNIPCAVLDWEILDSDFRDQDPEAVYAKMRVKVNDNIFTVTTGRIKILEQLGMVKSSRENQHIEDMSFTCIVRRKNGVVMFCPLDWSRKDVRKKEREEAEQNGSAD